MHMHFWDKGHIDAKVFCTEDFFSFFLEKKRKSVDAEEIKGYDQGFINRLPAKIPSCW